MGALPVPKAPGSTIDGEYEGPVDVGRGSAVTVYDAIACDLASLGAAVCLYALSVATDPPLGLSALHALTSRTGGTLCYYADLTDGSSLPDDVYKQLTSPFASQGLLRLRTSPQLTLSRSYGAAIQDARMQDLFHVAGCHEDTTVAFTFEYASSAGFDDGSSSQPMLQVAYTYWVLERSHDEGSEGKERSRGDSSAGPVRAGSQQRPWGLVRRLRVQTIPLQLAQSMRRLYESLDERVMLLLLTHKVISAIQQEGYREGRLLLQNWLVGLLAQYQLQYEAHPDCILYPGELCAPLRAVPQWVYGLLRGPLLASHTPLSAHRLSADGRTAMYTLYRSLSTDDLVTVLQPVLTAYSSSESRAGEDLPLSWDAMRLSGCRLFLLDAYTHIFIYLAPHGSPPNNETGSDRHRDVSSSSHDTASGADGDLPLPHAQSGAPAAAHVDTGLEFPPKQSSQLWKDAVLLKQRRLRSPSIICCSAGTPDGDRFEGYMDRGETNSSASEAERHTMEGSFSFSEFLGFIHREALACRQDDLIEAA